MKKNIKLPLHIKLVDHSDQIVLNVQFENKAISDWSLALCLLKEGLISALLVSDEDAKHKLEIEIIKPAINRVKAHAIFESAITRLKITANDLDYLLHFFLKYYRDDLAEVDHIDLEVLTASGKDASITFKVAKAMTPLSVEEAKKRLGL